MQFREERTFSLCFILFKLIESSYFFNSNLFSDCPNPISVIYQEFRYFGRSLSIIIHSLLHNHRRRWYCILGLLAVTVPTPLHIFYSLVYLEEQRKIDYISCEDKLIEGTRRDPAINEKMDGINNNIYYVPSSFVLHLYS